jgi:hypothetical protein
MKTVQQYRGGKKRQVTELSIFFKGFQLWIKFLAHITLQELLYMCLNARECKPLSSLWVLESLTKSSYLWALVWSSIPCFIPNLSVSLKWLKSGTLSFHETGFSWEDLQDLILTGLDVMKSMSSSQGTGEGNPKLGMELPEDQFMWERQLVWGPIFSSTVFIPTSHLVPSFSERGA